MVHFYFSVHAESKKQSKFNAFGKFQANSANKNQEKISDLPKFKKIFMFSFSSINVSIFSKIPVKTLGETTKFVFATSGFIYNIQTF